MSKKIKIIVVMAIVAIGIGGLLIYTIGNNERKETKPAGTNQTTTITNKLSSSSDKKIVSYQGETGKTALEILRSLAMITTEKSDYGEFVTGINGVQAESGKQFWAFYVNGVLASEGAGSYNSKNGEKIEWKIEAIKL